MQGKTFIIAKFHWADLVICNSRERKSLSYSQINRVNVVSRQKEVKLNPVSDQQ